MQRRTGQIHGVLLAVLFCALFLFSSDAQAQFHPGVRAGAYFDAESAFIGGEVVSEFTDSWYFVPNVEYIFIDNGDLWTFNFDFQVDLPTEASVKLWIGGGPAILFLDPDLGDSDADFGVNIFFGIGFPLRGSKALPYIQPKMIISDNSEFALALGIRF